jgi:nucleotide-binding universal stress UspA family protein
MAKIVVGIDESEPSREALRWAVEEGRLRHADVVALHAWLPPALPAALDLAPAPVAPPPNLPEVVAEAKAAAEDLVHGIVEEVVGEDTGVDVRTQTVEGPPATTLIEASGDAELLVVGSRGRGGFTGLLLGSTSLQCVTHARCPVVVHRVPADS